jgi:hypothetical protein
MLYATEVMDPREVFHFAEAGMRNLADSLELGAGKNSDETDGHKVTLNSKN